MKQPKLLLKIAVLASALILVGGLVSYRAGAFDWLVQPPDPPALMPSSKVGIITDITPTPTEGGLPATETPPAVFMGGSKSLSIGPVINTPPYPIPYQGPNQGSAEITEPSKPNIMIYSSKSGIMIPPKTPAAQPPAPPSPPQPPQ